MVWGGGGQSFKFHKYVLHALEFLVYLELHHAGVITRFATVSEDT